MMSDIPYIQIHVSDYLADTMHLQAEANGAYLLLIFNYWQTKKPIHKNRLQGIARVSNESWPDVEELLKEFFIDTGTHWRHSKIEADLIRMEMDERHSLSSGKPYKEKKDSNNSLGKDHGPIFEEDADPEGSSPESILAYLNSRAGTKYRPGEANLKLIRARLAERHTAQDLKRVIDSRAEAWLRDPKMSMYLRPATLFNQLKFSQYLGQVGAKIIKTNDQLLDEWASDGCVEGVDYADFGQSAIQRIAQRTYGGIQQRSNCSNIKRLVASS